MKCWFCEVIESDPKKALNLKLYGEVDATTSESITKVKYVLHNVDVSRCQLCKSKHRLSVIAFTLSCTLLFISLLSAILRAFSVITGFIAGILVGAFAGIGLSGIAYAHGILKGTHSVNYARKNHPEVKSLLEKGYKFGKGIKDHTREMRSAQENDQSIATTATTATSGSVENKKS